MKHFEEWPIVIQGIIVVTFGFITTTLTLIAFGMLAAFFGFGYRLASRWLI